MHPSGRYERVSIVASTQSGEAGMHGWWTSKVVPGMTASVAIATALAAQATPVARREATLDACTLATNAEVQQVAEEKPELAKFWTAPMTLAGGMRCEYSGGSLEVYEAQKGTTAAQSLERTLEVFKVNKEPRVPVQGIGERAFFMIPKPNDEYQRIGLLAVYAGPRVITLTLDAHAGEPLEATRPRLERFAKLVLPRLR